MQIAVLGARNKSKGTHHAQRGHGSAPRAGSGNGDSCLFFQKMSLEDFKGNKKKGRR